jgi:superfamily II DNA/RNA helicase
LTRPRAAIVVTGSELVRGDRSDLNGPFYAREALTLGLVPDRITIVGDGRNELAAALHGGLTQGARNRTLGQFKSGAVPVLVATDVAARGIHVDDVGLVIQADPAADHKDYLHRAGRTARAGGAGTVVTLVLPHQRRSTLRLAETAGVDAAPVQARPGDGLVTRPPRRSDKPRGQYGGRGRRPQGRARRGSASRR